jgi:hypothetical protein
MIFAFDSNSAVPRIDQGHAGSHTSPLGLNRRRLLKLGFVSAVAARWRVRFKRNPRRERVLPPFRRNTPHRTADLALIPFPGSTRMAITTRAQCRMSNYRTFITSRESSPAAMVSTAWARTTRAKAHLGHSHNRLQLHGRRILGRAPGTSSHFRSHLTYRIPRIGGPREPDS